MNTEMKNAVLSADNEEQYDNSAKRLLANKGILAYILVNTVEEFRGMKPKDVVPLIEGEPYVSNIPVEPGLTNYATDKNGVRIVGINAENEEKNEGLIRFDIVFYVRMKDGLSQMIINVEAQKDEPERYDILNRAVFYVSRLISSQKERDFEKINYNDIKCVYGIWVCMNMEENSLCHIHMVKDDLLGCQKWKGKIDLMNIIMIGLSDKLPKHDEMYELHRLLVGLFSRNISQEEKFYLLGEEYGIPLEENIREDVKIMCNLSQGIKEEGIREGRLEEKISLVIKKVKKGMTSEEVADCLEEPEANIRIIYDVVKSSAPEYDMGRIMEECKKEHSIMA